MAGFLYYVPKDGPKADLIHLGRIIDRARETRGIRGGPDNGNGTMVADPARVPADLLGYYPDRQTWRKAPGVANYWVGIINDKRPTPVDLARPDQLRGHPVKLGDGNEWLIPVARGLRETEAGEIVSVGCILPTRVDVDDEGNWISGVVQPIHANLWDVACRWEQVFASTQSGEKVEFNFADGFDAALSALATNYAVDKTEAAMLGLFDDRCVYHVLGALIDMPVFAEWCKKKAMAEKTERQAAPAGSNTSDGA